MKKYLNLYVDLHNILWMTRHSRVKTVSSKYKKDPYAATLIAIETIKGIVHNANKFGATGVIIAKEGGKSWRYGIYDAYKDRLDEPDIYTDEVNQAATMVGEFFKEHTASLVIQADGAEGDDVIAVGIQRTDPGIKSLILSSDQDFIQLMNDDVSLYSITQKEFRESDDPELDLFIKCVRGDRSDNILSAFPRVRKDRLVKAWGDPVELMNLMEETNPLTGKKVGEMIDFNFELIDLTRQPDWVRNKIETCFSCYEPSRFRQLSMPKIIHETFGVGDQHTQFFDGNERAFIKPPVFSLA